MSGELEAAGALTTAGLAGGVIEGREPTQAGDGECLNCGAPLNGRFCSNCGQASKPTRTLWQVVEELASGLFNFDTKVWRTLPRLMGRPGTLTREYVHGKRARYVSPLALFLLCIFLLFFVFSLMPRPSAVNLGDAAAHIAQSDVEDARDNLNDARDGLREAQQNLAEMRQELGAKVPSAAQRTAESALQRAVALAQAAVERRQAQVTRAEQRQVELANERRQNAAAGDAQQPAAVVSTESKSPVPPEAIGTSAPPAVAAETGVPPVQTSTATDSSGFQVGDGETLDDALRRISRDNLTVDGRPLLSDHMREQLADPPLFYYRLQEAASKFSFLLVPISLPFIAFLFLFKKDITFYDHTVFALNSLSFVALMSVIVMLSTRVEWFHWVPGTALLIVLPIHTFFHIGGAYSLKWWSALWRTAFLLIFSWVSLCLFLAAVLYIGLAG